MVPRFGEIILILSEQTMTENSRIRLKPIIVLGKYKGNSLKIKKMDKFHSLLSHQ